MSSQSLRPLLPTEQAISHFTLYSLALLYFILVLTSVIQLIRIQIKIPELGWTTQKLFLVLTIGNSLVRTIFFAIVPLWGTTFTGKNFFTADFHDPIFTILDDLPATIFWSTYTFLILFWAEIVAQARDTSRYYIKRMRPTFITLNIMQGHNLLDIVDNVFYSVIALSAALCFLIFGGRLYLMLTNFPIESKARKQKTMEVGLISSTCTCSFTIRCILVLYSTFSEVLVAGNIFILTYFLVVEIVPSFLVLFVLRKLPQNQKQAIENENSLLNQRQQDIYYQKQQSLYQSKGTTITSRYINTR